MIIYSIGDCEFKKVKTGREQDRVYMLKYMSGGQRLMYWMQNKSTEKDEELVKKINDLFNNPNAATTTASSGGATAGPGANAGISQDEWMQLLG